MNILFITMDPIEVNTSANIRNRGLIKGIIKCGHEVHTCSLEPDTDSIYFDNGNLKINEILNKRYYIKQDKIYSRFRTKKNVNYSNVGKGGNSLSSNLKMFFIAKIKKIFSEILKLGIYDYQKVNVKKVKKVKIDVSEYDVVISSSDPPSAHLIAEKLIKNSKKKSCWIQYWGDPMLGDVSNPVNGLKKSRIIKEEARLLSLCDSIIYTSPFTLEYQKKIYDASAGKMHYAVQAASERSGFVVAEQVVSSEKCKAEFKMGYFGDYPSRYRNILPLFQAVDELEIDLIVCGKGDVSFDSKYVTQVGRVNADELMQYQNEVNAIICLCNNKGTQVPGKIYYESSQNLPIILIVDGENQDIMRAFFESFERYIVCDNSVESIKKSIIIAKDEIASGKKYAVPFQMRPETVAAQILASINGIVV